MAAPRGSIRHPRPQCDSRRTGTTSPSPTAPAPRRRSRSQPTPTSKRWRLGRAATFAADMSEREAPAALVSAVERELGPVDILIANAGINDPMEQDPRKIDAAVWDQVMTDRTPAFLAASSGGRRDDGPGSLGGSCCCLRSRPIPAGSSGHTTRPRRPPCMGSRTRCRRFHVRPLGVTVFVGRPALIATDMMPTDERALEELAARIPVGRLGRSEEVADLIAAIVRNPYLASRSILSRRGHPPDLRSRAGWLSL